MEILEAQDDMEDAKDAVDIKSLEKEIIFDKVSFSYDQTPVLEDFSLKIEKGKPWLLLDLREAEKPLWPIYSIGFMTLTKAV
jgi:ABC-type bacteriocin/lantibiotic exporter with double-glycine peptidase domain